MLKKFISGLAAATVLAVTPALAQELKEINFGIISTESSQNLKSDWQPILDDMAKKTGLKVNAFFASDYAGIIEGMRFNKVHVAWYGNKSAMEAVDRAGGEVFAQMVNADGTQGYYSHLIVNKDSPLKTLDDVLQERQEPVLRQRRPQFDLGLPGPRLLRFCKEQDRRQNLLQGLARRQPREQRPGRGQQAGRRGHLQQRGDGEGQGTPAREVRRSASSGPRR
jgi:phosphonate transport system substrate-binding protein